MSSDRLSRGRRRYDRCLSVCGLLLSLICPGLWAAQSKPPNIVLILADDLGFSDLRSYGSEVETPSIDALAAAGVRFSNYHTAASCAPSRAMLMSGVDSHRAGVANMPEAIPSDQEGQSGYTGVLGENVVTIANLLGDSGYHTYMTGKWHLGKATNLLPSARGFERTLVMADTGADNWEQKPYLPIYSRANWFENGEPATLPQDFYSSKYFIDKTIEYISANLGDGRPFFTYIAFQAVHIPVQAPQEFTRKYADTYNKGWSELRKRRYQGAVERGVVRPGLDISDLPTTLAWESLSEAEQRYEAKSMAVYAGMIDAMDFHIGRLVQYLKDSGEYENTVFIFASDNGPEPTDVLDPRLNSSGAVSFFKWWMSYNNYNEDYETLGEKSSYNMIGPAFASAAASPLSYYKFFSSEGGMRVPLIISGVDTSLSGNVVNGFAYVTDLVPTMLDIAGVNDPAGEYQGKSVELLSGRSLMPLVQGVTRDVYQDGESVGYELGGNSALFKGDYKIVRNRGPLGDNQWHLYNIKLDPAEQHNLEAQMPERLAGMLKLYEDYVAANGVLPVPEDYDQRRQVSINGLKNRLGPLLIYAIVGLVFILLATSIFISRYRSGNAV